MSKVLAGSKGRALGIIAMTGYALGFIPISYSKSCIDAPLPGESAIIKTQPASHDSTATSISWLRTLPYLRVHTGNIKDRRVVIVCAYTPELPFGNKIDKSHPPVRDKRFLSDIITWTGKRTNALK